MGEMVLEVLSEEIPARMQHDACTQLKHRIIEACAAVGLADLDADAYATPRRLVLHVRGLPTTLPDQLLERRGPRADAPAAAVAGFARSLGCDAAALEVRQTAKGTYYFASSVTPGAAVADVIGPLVQQALGAFRWPKSMRWGDGDARWVRPLQSILCLVGHGGDWQVIPFEFAALRASNITRGHRFLAPDARVVTSWRDYIDTLERAYVCLDGRQREQRIEAALRRITKERRLRLLDDPTLLREVAGLVEWPTVLIGEIDPSFRDMPAALLTEVMRSHQKYFAAIDDGTGATTHFLLVSNAAEAMSDHVLAGNRRVLNARLKDAEYYWRRDLDAVKRGGLTVFADALAKMRFHEKLGDQQERTERLATLAAHIAPLIGAASSEARDAAHRAKLDLVSDTVGEFPALQGQVGRYLAEMTGEDPEIAKAIFEHYLPVGSDDVVPQAPLSVALGLADRIDYLAGFFAIDEAPTGSRDPHALRRCAIGLVRLLLTNRLHLPLEDCVTRALRAHGSDLPADTLIAFILDRLDIHLRQAGSRHDVMRACIDMPGRDDLLALEQRALALGHWIDTAPSATVIATVRRLVNMMGADGTETGDLDHRLLGHPTETALAAAIEQTERGVAAALTDDRFGDALQQLEILSAPINGFLDAVRVQCDDPDLRMNRLRLLARAREVIFAIANWSHLDAAS